MYPSLNINGSEPQELYHTPSPIHLPLEDEAVFFEFFQQQFFSNDHEVTNNMESALGEYGNNNGQIAANDGDDDRFDCNTHVEPDNGGPRKKHSSGDRHSKVNTARGPRDRRMRLSLDVAKKLFGLQDLLGFDKASKTVDWLLTESKTAILDLLPDRACSFMGVSNSVCASSTSDDQATTKHKAKCSRVRKCASFHDPLAKETRIRARQRARERTIEKQNKYKHGIGQDSTFGPCLDQVMDQDVSLLGSWSTFQERERQSIDQLIDMNSNFQFNQGFVGDNSSFFDYQHGSGVMDEVTIGFYSNRRSLS